MSAIVFLSLPFSSGHIHPTLGVVKELVGQGEKVIYYATDSFAGKIKQAGAVFRNYPRPVDDFCQTARTENINNFLLIAEGLQTCQRIIPTLIREVEKDRPALIVHEILCPWGKIVATELAVPAAAYVTSLVINEQTMPWSYRLRLARDCVMDPKQIGRIRRLAAELEASYGQSCSSVFEIIGNQQPLNLVFTSREFQLKGLSFDDSYRFVGSSLGSREERVDFPWERLQGKRVIYISLGTVFHRDPDFYRICLKAFADTDYQIVISVGDPLQLRHFADAPGHFLVKPYVPQLEVLQRADLFITHGGMNSVNEALSYAVPLIVIPKDADQPIIARRITELGAGVKLKRRGLTAQQLRTQAVKLLTDPSFAVNARKIGETLRSAGGYQQAAREIVHFLRGRSGREG